MMKMNVIKIDLDRENIIKLLELISKQIGKYFQFFYFFFRISKYKNASFYLMVYSIFLLPLKGLK